MGSGTQRRRTGEAVSYLLVAQFWALGPNCPHSVRPRPLPGEGNGDAEKNHSDRGVPPLRTNDLSPGLPGSPGALGLGQHEGADLGLFSCPAISLVRSDREMAGDRAYRRLRRTRWLGIY